MRKVIVISGLPGSGKTTLGRSLARLLGYQFLDKDDFLEAKLNTCSNYTSELRNKLSRESDAEFIDAVRKSDKDSIVVSFWRHPSMKTDSGTPLDWLVELNATVFEIYCECSSEIAIERFVSRKRHPGHLDHLRSKEQLQIQFEGLTELGPINLWPLKKVETSGHVSLENILDSIVG